MHREALRSKMLKVAAVAGTLLVSACSSGAALTSTTDPASESAPAAATSVVETSETELTTTTLIAATAVPTTGARKTIPAPATTLATTLPAEPVGDPASPTVAPAPTLAPAPASTVPPATTQSGPCPVVNHNPATTAGCGDATPLVLEVQQDLACVGDPVPEDGVFGPTTYQAVLAYQMFAGLTPDGLAGPNTRAGLSDACFSGDY